MTILKKVSLLLGALGLTLAPSLALAQTGVGVTASTSVSVQAKLPAAEVRLKERGEKEIDRRVAALNSLNTRVQAMQRISDQFKQSLSATVAAEVTALNALKAKIAADTEVEVLRADLKSVTENYRIYALVLPQGRIAAAADRIATIVTMMGTLGGKLQTRVQAAGQAGADITALNTSLTEMSSNLNTAQTQAQAAITLSATLQPDGGDKAKMAANNEALKKARTALNDAHKATVAARKNAADIVAGLAKVNANATSTTQTTTP